MKKKNVYKVVLAFLVVISLIIVQSAWSQYADWQTRPIQLGTSGGNINDINRRFCCSGTLGGLVQDGNGIQYILSVNHVLARTNKGVEGDDVIQPGLIDQEPGCNQNTTDAVADLSRFVSISFNRGGSNTVDAAIAQIRNGQVNPTGPILGIGQLSSDIAGPSLNMPVQKSGRTTGHTTGNITGVNATVTVVYDRTCGRGARRAKFTNQFRIGPAGFSAGGDSGSFIVENSSPNPRAVGLLFAGSSTDTFANPISYVLSSLGVMIVGAGSPSPFSVAQSLPGVDASAVEAVNKVKERYEEDILNIEGVVGIGIGLSETVPGEVVIEVYIEKPLYEMTQTIPDKLEGIPVKIVETGEIVAY
jgi:hypothetical protein